MDNDLGQLTHKLNLLNTQMVVSGIDKEFATWKVAEAKKERQGRPQIEHYLSFMRRRISPYFTESKDLMLFFNDHYKQIQKAVNRICNVVDIKGQITQTGEDPETVANELKQQIANPNYLANWLTDKVNSNQIKNNAYYEVSNFRNFMKNMKKGLKIRYL